MRPLHWGRRMRSKLLMILALAAAGCDGGTNDDPAPTDGAPPPDAAPPGDADAPPGDAAPPDAAPAPDAAPEPDGGPVDPWAGCPGPETAIADPSWPNTLRAAGAEYCTAPREHGDLRQDRTQKATLRLPDGDYRLPAGEDGGPFALPICVRGRDGALWRSAGAGTLRATRHDRPDRTIHQYALTQPLTDGTSTRPFEGRIHLVVLEGEAPVATFDGRHPSPFGDDDGFAFTLCAAGESCDDEGARRFDACAFDGVPAQRHHVRFDDGEVALTVRIGESPAGTEPAAFVRAEGTWDDTPFVVTDPWRLLYRPSHHHFQRDFGVLFETPVGDVCGLEIVRLDGFGGFDHAEAWTVDCDFVRVAPLTIRESTVER